MPAPYTFATGQAFSPGDPNNTFAPGAWVFAGLDDGAQHILALELTGDINVNWGAGPIPSVAIVPGSTGESYGKKPSELDEGLSILDEDLSKLDGAYRIPGDISDINLVSNAVLVPEPASMALLGTGLLFLGFASRRRNRNSA